MNKLAKIGMAGWTIFCFVGSCAGMVNVANSKHGGVLSGAESLGAGLGLFIWLLIWAVPVVALGMIALITKPKTAPVPQQPPAMLCANCGRYYTGTARFCPLCGGQQIAR